MDTQIDLHANEPRSQSRKTTKKRIWNFISKFQIRFSIFNNSNYSTISSSGISFNSFKKNAMISASNAKNPLNKKVAFTPNT